MKTILFGYKVSFVPVESIDLTAQFTRALIYVIAGKNPTNQSKEDNKC